MPSMSAKVTQAGALLITVALQRRSSVIHLLLVLQAPYRNTKFLFGISCCSKPIQILLSVKNFPKSLIRNFCRIKIFLAEIIVR